MRILLTGATGQIGWELRRTLAPLGEIVAPGRAAFDLARPDTLGEAVRRIAPDLIVNPAAYTAVDLAESERALAFRINAAAPEALAVAARELGIPLLHYSTDYVFDGHKLGPYRETDTPHPLGVYGASKLAGEAAVAAQGGPHLILRTAWVYGLRGKNFLLTLRKLARERDRLRVVNDQFGAPTWSRLVAEASTLVLARWLARPAYVADSGIYHLTCAGRASWHEFAAAILVDLERREGRRPALEAIPGSDYPTAATRPANSRLDCSRLEQAFGVRLPDWRAALELCLESGGATRE